MKKWFQSLSKTLRGLITISLFAIGGGLILLYAWYRHLLLLIFGIVFVVAFVFFFALNGRIVQEEKFALTPEEEAEHRRKIEESERKGEEDAALIPEEQLSAEIERLQKLCEEKEKYYNRTADVESRKAAAYEMMYTNSKLRAAIKRKMKILRPDTEKKE